MKTVADCLADCLRSVFPNTDMQSTVVLFPDPRLGIVRTTTVRFSLNASGDAAVSCDPDPGVLGRDQLNNLKRYIIAHCVLRWPRLKGKGTPARYYLPPTDGTHGDPVLAKGQLAEDGLSPASLYARLKSDLPYGLEVAFRDRLRLAHVPGWADPDGMARVLMLCPWMPVIEDELRGRCSLWVPCDVREGRVAYVNATAGASRFEVRWFPLIMDLGADEPNPLPYGLKPLLTNAAQSQPVAWLFPSDIVSGCRRLHCCFVRTRRGSSHGDRTIPTGLGRWHAPRLAPHVRAKTILP